MDVFYFLKQRTDLIRHFYDAAAAPFVGTKQSITDGQPPFHAPPFDDSGEPPYLAEWLRADVEHELVGRAAVSMLSEALKQFLVTSERQLWRDGPCAGQCKKAFKLGFVNGYKECFTLRLGIDWSTCPADLNVLKQVVLVRNSAQHPDLVLDHLTHDEPLMKDLPSLFFVRPEDEGAELDGSVFLAPAIRISREKLHEAIAEAEKLGLWLQQQIEEWLHTRWKTRRGDPDAV